MVKRMDDMKESIKPARIHIKHLTVKGTPCVKILGFEGIKGSDDLPASYVDGTPSFYLRNAYWNIRIFDGESINLGGGASGSGVNIRLPDGVDTYRMFGPYSTMLSVGDVIEEKAFQEICIWLKRAGSRLAKIRAEKKCEWVVI